MSENTRKEKQDEIIISFQKIGDNVKKYWWICLITTLLSLLAVLVIAISNKNKQEGKQIQGVVYQASTLVYMEPKQLMTEDFALEYEKSASSDEKKKSKEESLSQIADDYNRSVELNKQSIINSLNEWYWNKNSQLMYDCTALLSSNKVISQINDVLIKEKLDAYDAKLDDISMEIKNNSRLYTITVRCEDEERAVLIADTATEALIKEAEEVFSLSNSKIIDRATTGRYRKTDDVNNPYELVTDGFENKQTEPTILGINKNSILKYLLIIFVGIFLGLGIIFIYVLKDKKIRNRNEMSLYFDISYMGIISNKKSRGLQSSYEVLAETLIQKCRKDEIKEVMITSPTKQTGYDQFKAKLTECVNKRDAQIKICYGENFVENPDAVKLASKVDGIVVLIKTNGEEIPEIEKTLDTINLISGNVMGYVLN